MSIHSGQARISSPTLAKRPTWRCWSSGVQICTLGRSDGSTVSFTKPNTNGLTIRHSDVTTETIKNVVLCADGICLVNKVDESTFLRE